MNNTDLTIQDTIEITRLYSNYRQSDLKTAIYESVAYDLVKPGDEYYSITGVQIVTESYNSSVKRLIKKRAPKTHNMTHPYVVSITPMEIYGTDSVKIPDGYEVIGLGLVKPGQPYLGVSYRQPIIEGKDVEPGMLRLLLKTL